MSTNYTKDSLKAIFVTTQEKRWSKKAERLSMFFKKIYKMFNLIAN